MARSRYKIIEAERPHFVTCTTSNWLSLFSSANIANVLLDSLTFLVDNKRIIIYAYVIMEHHVHLLLSSGKLSKEIGIFKSFTARKIIDYLQEKKAEKILNLLSFYKLKHKKDRTYQLWQEGNHPQAIVNEEMMLQKIEYIHYNPVRCGYVDRPEHWRYSSARDYVDMEGLLRISRF